MASDAARLVDARVPRTAPGRAWPQAGPLDLLRIAARTGPNYLRWIETLQPDLGDLFRMRVGPIDLHVVAAPAQIDEILKAPRDLFVKNPLLTREMRSLGPESIAVLDGERWAAHRRQMAPPFRPAASQTQGHAIQAALEAWGTRLAEHEGSIRAIETETADFTFSALMRMMLGETLPELEAPIREGLEAEIRCLTRRVTGLVRVPDWAPTPNQRALRRARRTLDEAIRVVVARAARPDGGGFASVWLAAHREAGHAPETADEILRDQLMTILTAGHQTAAFGLAYCLWQVAAHPSVEAELVDELQATLDGRSPTLADLDSLPGIDAAVRETLRLYPVLPVILRRSTRPTRLGALELPAGANVALSLWSAHRHPMHWSAPERFDPTRFRGEAARHRHPGAFVPFASGSRNCLAAHFAQAEMRLALAYLLQRFRFELVPEHDYRVEPQLALAPANGIPLRVFARRPSGGSVS